jgi:hypothetical protein
MRSSLSHHIGAIAAGGTLICVCKQSGEPPHIRRHCLWAQRRPKSRDGGEEGRGALYGERRRPEAVCAQRRGDPYFTDGDIAVAKLVAGCEGQQGAPLTLIEPPRIEAKTRCSAGSNGCGGAAVTSCADSGTRWTDRPGSPIGLVLFRHFNAKSLTERFDVVCVVFIYLITGMEFYYVPRRDAFHDMTTYRAFPGQMLGSVLASEDVVSLRVQFERVDIDLVA